MAQKSLFDLTGRNVVMTGGSRGLGRAMVQAFAERGANVVIASRDGTSCEAVAREINAATGARALGLGLHVGNWDALEPFVDRVEREFAPIDVLVNNAGMSPVYDQPTDITEAMFDQIFDVNLKGPFRLSALVAQRMAARSGGSIINISSMAAVRPRPHTLPYAAAKAGLNALTTGLAHAYGPKVRVNAIMAGTFLTDSSKAWDAELFENRARTFALGRGGEPEEIVGTALYLASDASSYTTGAVLAVDGGQP
jgi:NAD(P)-dependent dehydrogenase (short-subunit alcohol dehydrogenase family)